MITHQIVLVIEKDGMYGMGDLMEHLIFILFPLELGPWDPLAQKRSFMYGKKINRGIQI